MLSHVIALESYLTIYANFVLYFFTHKTFISPKDNILSTLSIFSIFSLVLVGIRIKIHVFIGIRIPLARFTYFKC